MLETLRDMTDEEIVDNFTLIRIHWSTVTECLTKKVAPTSSKQNCQRLVPKRLPLSIPCLTTHTVQASFFA
jgi:hypothetical protein